MTTFSLRLTPELHKRLSKEAARRKVSMNALIVESVTDLFATGLPVCPEHHVEMVDAGNGHQCPRKGCGWKRTDK